MSPTPQQPAMSQRIFSLGLGVETVSLYLLCCAVADTGVAITEARLLDKWNGDRTSLERELQRLTARKIIARSQPSVHGEAEYCLLPERHWN